MKFEKSKFVKDGPYCLYEIYGDRRFVARFKYGSQASFIAFLVKNFTVDEYFEELRMGVPPLTILESKGYISDNVKKLLKSEGYPLSREGFRNYIVDQLRPRG